MSIRLKQGFVNNVLAMGLALVGFALATTAARASGRATELVYWLGGVGLALSAFSLCRPWMVRFARSSATAARRAIQFVRMRGHAAAPAVPSAAVVHSKISGTDDRALLVQRFLDQGRTAILLRSQIARTLAPEHLEVVKDVLRETMALMEPGTVVVGDWTLEECDQFPGQTARHCEEVSACFIDRFPVTNRQFRSFLADGGYGQQSLWDAGIWSRISEFVDRTGFPGPRHWENGVYPPEQDEWPVVGVSWYEADAYARWVGRRLPTDAEWTKAAALPVSAGGSEPVQRRFPWGDSADPRRANLWITGLGRPAAVTQFPQGATPAGVHHLIGNVWEWTTSDVQILSYGRDVRFGVPLKSLRGGAYDTYFENQATCQLQSGDSPLARRHNIGFRCALSATDIIDVVSPSET